MGKPPTLNAVTRQRLKAYPHDHVLRWLVKSLSRPEMQHVVDLEAFHGNGACSCEHFEFRLAPLLRDGIGRAGSATRCGHILVAREAFTNHMVQLLSAKAAELAAEETYPCPRCRGETEVDGEPCAYCFGEGTVDAEACANFRNS